MTSFDKIAQIYDETREAPTQAELDSLLGELEDSQKVLELGVGTGRIAQHVQRQGLEIVGVDVSGQMLRRAKEKGVNVLVRADASRLPFADKSFDASIMIHFLHLIAEWKPVIQEIARVTRNILVSLDSKRPEVRVSIRRAYLDKVKQRGVVPAVRMEGEVALAEKMKPSKMERIETPKFRRRVGSILDEIENRWLAISCGVPDHVHHEIVRELRREYPNEEIEYHYETYIMVWKIDELVRSDSVL